MTDSENVVDVSMTQETDQSLVTGNSRQLSMANDPFFRSYVDILKLGHAVGKGQSLARHATANNGQEYIVKGPAINPQLPYSAANEIISAEIANLLGLPTLDHRILQYRGDFYFGASWMQTPTHYPMTDASLFASAVNKDDVYLMTVMDTWICNEDRHHENLITRKIRAIPNENVIKMLGKFDNREDRIPATFHTLAVVDHDRALLAGIKAFDQANWLPQRHAVTLEDVLKLSFVKNHLTDSEILRSSVSRIESIPASRIINIVDSVPRPLLPDAASKIVSTFLLDRQVRLRGIIEAGMLLLPLMKGDAK